MTAKIGSLNVDVTMETARFKNGARQLAAETNKLEGRFGKLKLAGASLAGGLAGIGAGIAIGGLQEAVTGAFELASSMSEAASRIGVTVEALQELRVAAADNGVSNDALESSMARLNVQLGKLQAGAKPATAAFAAIGLSAADLKGLKPEESFARIADAIAAIPDPAQQAAAAQAIFGKSYAQLLPLIKEGSAALREAAEESRRNGQISTEEAKKLDQLADNWAKLKTRVGVATAGILASLVDFIDMLVEVRSWSDRVDASIAQFASNAVASAQRLFIGVKNWLADKLNAIWEGLLRRVDQAKKALSSLTSLFSQSNFQPASFNGGGGFQNASFFQIGAAMNDNADETEIATVRIAQSFKDMADQVLNALSGLVGAIKGGSFLDILQAVIGLGLQLGGAGVFGSKIADRINAPRIPTSTPSGSRGGASRGTDIRVEPSPYFTVVVDGRIVNASPSIMKGGAQIAQSQMAYRNTRRVA